MKIIVAVLVLTSLAEVVPVSAQELLTGVSQNAVIAKEAKKAPVAIKNGTAVKLPFLEDFSSYTGYPNPALWQDRQGFVNNTYPVFPPSIGVVTLDALDENGRVYAHAERTPFAADTLTSNLIRLDSNFTFHRPMYLSDSLYFSFYYQPGGACKSQPAVGWERIGDAPEQEDRLILEFGYATGQMVFIGFSYADYVIDEGQFYSAGDTIPNPYMPGTFYIFESNAFGGEVIQMPTDSLFGPEYVWNEVWSSDGTTVDSWLAQNTLDYFKQVMIPITDPQYLRDNFQFRFRNYASLDLDSWSSNVAGWASNCDQWHLDYIQLDVNRNAQDCFPNDVTFVAPTTSALTLYQSMPWHQFRASDMASSFHNELANISAGVKNTFYNYSVRKAPGTHIYTSTVNNENAQPYYDSGLHLYPYHADPSVNFVYEYDGADSATFYITHVFRMEGANDECLSNDTCRFEQKFYNYYAYDDGTAEAGYTLLSTMTNPDASLAVQFTLAEPDTLRCVRMWFNSVLDDENFEEFTLMVWADDNGRPGDVLYSLPSQLPAHGADYLDFINYYPEEPVALNGTFYVGFRQTHAVQLNLGFDQNNDARGHFFYKTSSTWQESFYKGAPMIRPVVGKFYDHSSVVDHDKVHLQCYPNPTTGMVYIDGVEDGQLLSCKIFDIYGRLVQTSALQNASVDMSTFAPGVYVLKIMQQHTLLSTEKIIKQ
ncbi:MAG: T9SS type A sorting domain-containing protein [Bacteroidales bacterium]|nr:T9SS type A sorting domain-containing protein [Bacteroidales bacterium]